MLVNAEIQGQYSQSHVSFSRALPMNTFVNTSPPVVVQDNKMRGLHSTGFQNGNNMGISLGTKTSYPFMPKS